MWVLCVRKKERCLCSGSQVSSVKTQGPKLIIVTVCHF